MENQRSALFLILHDRLLSIALHLEATYIMRWRVHGKASFFFSGAFPLPCLSFPIFDLFFYKSCFSAVVMRIDSHGTDQLKACKPYQPLVSWRVVVAYRRGVPTLYLKSHSSKPGTAVCTSRLTAESPFETLLSCIIPITPILRLRWF